MPEHPCAGPGPHRGAVRAEVVRRRSSGLRNEAGLELHSLVLNLHVGDRPRQVTAVVALERSDLELDLCRKGSVVPVRLTDEVDLRVEVDLDLARYERSQTGQ